uniref:Uncharacterized protein n=1 Tax=Oryzias sinensis TaxID=183150 RepID=A0A8C7WY17_9TELE
IYSSGISITKFTSCLKLVLGGSLLPALMNLLVNLGLFAAGVWVARNLSDFDLMSPQPVT